MRAPSSASRDNKPLTLRDASSMLSPLKTQRAKKFLREVSMPTRRDFIGSDCECGRTCRVRSQARTGARHGRRLAVAQRARDFADRDRRAGPEFPLYADQLKDKFGQSFVLENMPGGSGSIGCMAVARAAPDGHTLLLASNSHIVLAPLVLTNSPVKVKKDLRPDRADVHVPVPAAGQCGAAGALAQGVRRLRQGAAATSSTSARRASAPADIW